MTLYYARTTGGFYDTDIHQQDDIPTDAVEISGDTHDALMAGQAVGKQIVAGGDGAPVLADPPGPTPAELWAAQQARAKFALERSDTTILRCLEHGVAIPAAWTAYRTALRALVSASTGNPSAALPTPPAYPAGS